MRRARGLLALATRSRTASAIASPWNKTVFD
jgi:hypothetical protein